MPIRLLTSAADLDAYDQWVKSHPQGNLWQSVERMQYVASRNKEAMIYAWLSEDKIVASAQVIIDGTRGGLSTWEIPRGPLWSDKKAAVELMAHILAEATKAKVLTLYVAPIEALDLAPLGLHTSSRHVHAEATRILDLTMSDEKLLAQMHQKGRYNMNVARKNGVSVKQSQDIDAYYALAKKTGIRDGFGIPNRNQFKAFLEELPGSFLLLAYSSHENEKSGVMSDSRLKTHDSKPIAGLIGVTWQDMGIYYYGASDYEYRNLMAPYLLQWESIQLCKKAGCTHYDLLGVAPPSPTPTLPHGGRGHPWAGISSFKEKFGGTVISYPPEQEITLRPMMKWLLGVKRKIVG